MSHTDVGVAKPLGPLAPLISKIGKSWWVLLILGVAWIVVGFAALRFDDSTPTVIAVVFGIVVLLGAIAQVVRAVLTERGWRVLHIALAAILLAGAVTALVNPTGSFLTLALLVGVYFVAVGVLDIITSLFAAGVIPGWWLQLISGILEIVLGVMSGSSIENSAVLLVVWFAVTAVFRGIAEIALGFSVRALRTA